MEQASRLAKTWPFLGLLESVHCCLEVALRSALLLKVEHRLEQEENQKACDADGNNYEGQEDQEEEPLEEDPEQ